MKRVSWTMALLLGGLASLGSRTGAESAVEEGHDASIRESRTASIATQSSGIPPTKRKSGRDTCYAAEVLPGTPFIAVAGNTCSGTRRANSYTSANCNAVAYPGPEVLYTFTASGGLIYLELVPESSADLGIFLLRNCARASTCVDFHDPIGPGVASQVPRLSTGYLHGTYYLYVDSYYGDGAASCGDYELRFGGHPKTAELVSFSVD